MSVTIATVRANYYYRKKYTVPDKDGNPVEPPENGRITVGGAGFLKWIADGIVKPLSGSALKLEGLAAPTVLFSELGKTVLSRRNGILLLHWTGREILLHKFIQCVREKIMFFLNAVLM